MFLKDLQESHACIGGFAQEGPKPSQLSLEDLYKRHNCLGGHAQAGQGPSHLPVEDLYKSERRMGHCTQGKSKPRHLPVEDLYEPKGGMRHCTQGTSKPRRLPVKDLGLVHAQSSPPPPPPPLLSELDILTNFKDSVNTTSSAFSTWTGASYCSWYGITCNGGGAVTAVDLSYSSLSGSLPLDFGSLSQLSVLHLENNEFHGQLPSSWSDLGSSLVELYLGFNQVTGQLPPAWSSLTSSYKLFFQSNTLTGLIPSSWSSMSVLFRLVLDSNVDLCGDIPASLSSAVSYTGTGITVSCPGPPPPPPGLTYALLTLKAAVTDDPGNALVDWTEANAANQCVSWPGISCTGSAITSVDLSFFDLQVHSLSIWVLSHTNAVRSPCI
eukprot:gene48-12863_t